MVCNALLKDYKYIKFLDSIYLRIFARYLIPPIRVNGKSL